MNILCRNLHDLETEAVRFAKTLRPRKKDATLFGLSGELGAGKTAFVKGVAAALGVGEIVTSPTFVIEKIYALEGQSFAHLIHIDAYRLKGGEELAALGFREIAKDPQNLIFIEWPENVRELLPQGTPLLTFALLPDEARRITLSTSP